MIKENFFFWILNAMDVNASIARCISWRILFVVLLVRVSGYMMCANQHSPR